MLPHTPSFIDCLIQLDISKSRFSIHIIDFMSMVLILQVSFAFLDVKIEMTTCGRVRFYGPLVYNFHSWIGTFVSMVWNGIDLRPLEFY